MKTHKESKMEKENQIFTEFKETNERNNFDFALKHAHKMNVNEHENKCRNKEDFNEEAEIKSNKNKETDSKNNLKPVFALKKAQIENEKNDLPTQRAQSEQPKVQFQNFIGQNHVSPINELKENFNGSSIYQYLPINQQIPGQFHNPQNILVQNPYFTNTMPGFYPNLQNYMMHPYSQTGGAQFTNTNAQKNSSKPSNSIPKESQIQKFKEWTSQTKNQATGLEFYFSKKGCLFYNQSIRISIKQGKCFKEEVRPHLKFFLLFENISTSDFENMGIKLTTTCENYTLMANCKKLSQTMNPQSDQKLAFVIFPNKFPVDELFLQVKFESKEGKTTSFKNDFKVQVKIPFNKFLRFKNSQKLAENEINWKNEARVSKNFIYDEKLLRFPDELTSIFQGVNKFKIEKEGKIINVFRGIFYFLIDPKFKEFYFEAEFDEKYKKMSFSIGFLENQGNLELGLLKIVAEELENELKRKV